MNATEEQLIEEMCLEYKTKLRAMVNALEPKENINTTYVDFNLHAKTIADYFGVDSKIMLTTKTRKRDYVFGRMILFWFTRKRLKNVIAFREIGELAGGFNHATVIHSIKSFNWMYAYDTEFALIANDIIRTLGYKIVKEGKENYHPERLWNATK